MASRKQVTFNLTRCNVIIGFLLLLGSVSQAETKKNASDDKELIQKLSSRNLNFAFSIYKEMAKLEDGKMSPFGLSVSLVMTAFGTQNKTLEYMNAILDYHGFSDSMQIAKGYNAALKSLKLKGDITLSIVNRILIDKKYDIKKPFNDIVVNEFHSAIQKVDFSQNAKVLNEEISKYLDQVGHQKFKDLPWLGGGEEAMGAVLVSAIYFKGKWAKQFDPKNTKQENFHMGDDSKQMVPIMNAVGEFQYAEDATLKVKILKMDFSGARLVVYFILPNSAQICENMRPNITAEWFGNLKKKMQLKMVKVKLPKFNSNYLKDLSPELANLYTSSVAGVGGVDLADVLNPKPQGGHVYIYKVLHAAYVEMGEEGAMAFSKPQQGKTEGANNTSKNQQPMEFFVLHSFTFIIYDTTTNFILFIGNVDNPSN